MTTKDFFRVVLKLFGLNALVISLFTLIPQFAMFSQMDRYEEFDWNILYGLVWLVVAGALIWLFLYLTFRPDKLINWLKLHQGFDNDQIAFDKLEAATILQLGCIVVGGLTFVNNLPPTLVNIYVLFKASIRGPVHETLSSMFGLDANRTMIDLAGGFAKVAIGFLLITNHGRVGRLLK